jgi:hypothetical protein
MWDKMSSIAALGSSSSEKTLPVKSDFIYPNTKKSEGARSGEYGGACRI